MRNKQLAHLAPVITDRLCIIYGGGDYHVRRRASETNLEDAYSNVGIRHVAGSGPRVLFDYDGLMRATPGAAFSLHLLTAKATGTWDTYTSAEYLTW